MAVEPYAPCPCGSGKKLKFCCADLAADIERIEKLASGDQPHAALQHVEKLLAKEPDRASLLDMKAMLELSLHEFEAAERTLQHFLAKHPQNPSAHALAAMPIRPSTTRRAERVNIHLVPAGGAPRIFEAEGLLRSYGLVPDFEALFHAYLYSPDQLRMYHVGMEWWVGENVCQGIWDVEEDGRVRLRLNVRSKWREKNGKPELEDGKPVLVGWGDIHHFSGTPIAGETNP